MRAGRRSPPGTAVAPGSRPPRPAVDPVARLHSEAHVAVAAAQTGGLASHPTTDYGAPHSRCASHAATSTHNPPHGSDSFGWSQREARDLSVSSEASAKLAYDRLPPTRDVGFWHGVSRSYIPSAAPFVDPSLKLHQQRADHIDPVTYEVIRYSLLNLNLEHTA